MLTRESKYNKIITLEEGYAMGYLDKQMETPGKMFAIGVRPSESDSIQISAIMVSSDTVH